MPLVDAEPTLLGSRRHVLLVAEDDHSRRVEASRWVAHTLEAGEKIYYKGWHDPTAPVEAHWLAGPDGPSAGLAALRSGQIELADYPTVLDAAGGTNAGVREYHTAEIERALDEGYAAVAMAHETVKRTMADAAEAAEVTEHESGYDALMDRWPLRVLCQFTLAEENADATRETIAMHHRDLVDGQWSAGVVDGLWQPRGDVDTSVAGRFRAAAIGALRSARAIGADDDLHVDLSELDFIDTAGAQSLIDAAAAAADGQRVVLHRPSTLLVRLVEALGRPEHMVQGPLR